MSTTHIATSTTTPPPRITYGLFLGLLGVVCFGATFPMTKLAVGSPVAPLLDPLFVAIARAFFAAVLAAITLAFIGGFAANKRPRGDQWRQLALCAFGIVFGFPIFSTIAMRYVPVSHGAVISALLPLATAALGAWLARERPSNGFWLCALAGTVLVLGFAAYRGAQEFHIADIGLIAAMITGAVGYAYGGQLSKSLGALNVICWALLICVPITLPFALWSWPRDASAITTVAWGGFAYVSAVSMFLGFVFWYGGMAIAGVARVSQVQLLQPFITILFGAVLIREKIELTTLLFAIAVIAVVFVGRKMPTNTKA